MIHPERRRENLKKIEEMDNMDEKNKPKKPMIEKAIYDLGSWWFVCPECYSILNIDENCQTCKQVIDWSEQT